MSNAAPEVATPSPSEYLATTVRAELGRRGLSLSRFAAVMGKPAIWTIRRVGPSRTIDPTLDEAAEIAAALGLELVDLIDSPRVLNPL